MRVWKRRRAALPVRRSHDAHIQSVVDVKADPRALFALLPTMEMFDV